MLDKSGGLYIGQSNQREVSLLLNMANRHGLITGATGTGKTVTLQTLAESFSAAGVPVFAADIKGDLSGVSKQGGGNKKVEERVAEFALRDKGFNYKGFPVCFWDVFAEQGHPVRTTISDMGPFMLSRLLSLNETQEGVLTIVFKIADENNLLLLDFKDLKKMLEYVGNNRTQFTTAYGMISTASIGAIQRSLLQLGQQGGERFFGEPALNIFDLIQTEGGQGVINILAADKLMQSPRVYTTFLLWLMAELYEKLPEAGDLDKPRIVFFFDEAHLLFKDAPKVLVDKIEQTVRLIRSKGVGIYFVTQSPTDIPDSVLGQLGNRVQHALRAFTPKDQKAVRAAAQTFRANPAIDTEQAITEMGVGEALVSCLDAKGAPLPVERMLILPPQGQIGPINYDERMGTVKASMVYGEYEKSIDRESAYELLQLRIGQELAQQQQAVEQKQAGKVSRPSKPEKSLVEDLMTQLGRSVSRQLGNEIGRTITRGIFGSIFGKKR